MLDTNTPDSVGAPRCGIAAIGPRFSACLLGRM